MKERPEDLFAIALVEKSFLSLLNENWIVIVTL